MSVFLKFGAGLGFGGVIAGLSLTCRSSQFLRNPTPRGVEFNMIIMLKSTPLGVDPCI